MDSLTPAETMIRDGEQLTNSLTSLAEQVNTAFGWEGFPAGIGGPQISSTDTLFNNNRWYLISNLRQLLSQVYVEHGIVQTLVDQPVDDAFRAGFDIETAQLDANDLEQVHYYLEEFQIIGQIMQAIKWGRLYGGGGVLPLTDQDPETKFNIKAINRKTPLEFRSVDMWELYYDVQNTSGSTEVGKALGASISEFYDYYGHPIHKSRVMRVVGKEAPSFIRPRLRGWGMSELERLVRSLNQYIKNQDLIFQLLDEAKVDVYRIKGYNNALLNQNGTNAVSKKIALANRLKSFNSALVMDLSDEYEQKQITFSGLAEVLLQIRQGIAADLKMPMTKLFGISAAGFNSGEDDIENYNSMIEGEIRHKNKWLVIKCLKIVCQKLFDFYPTDLNVNFKPLRILNAKEEEEVKDSKFNRITSAFTIGLASGQEAKESINADNLLAVEVDETTDALPPLDFGGGEPEEKPKGASGTPGKKTPTED